MEPSLPLSKIITVSMMPIIGVSTGSGGSSPADIKALQDRLTKVENTLATKADVTDLVAKANSSQLGYALVDAGTVSSNKRYVFDNPFGINTPVITQFEVYLEGVWGAAGWMFAQTENKSQGLSGGYVEGVGLVAQVGNGGVTNNAGFTGGTTGNQSYRSLAPCRIHVWKVSDQ